MCHIPRDSNLPRSCISCSRYKVLAFVRMFHWLFVSSLILHWFSVRSALSFHTGAALTQHSVCAKRVCI